MWIGLNLYVGNYNYVYLINCVIYKYYIKI